MVINEEAFDDIKVWAISAKDWELTYSDHSQEFEIYTDASSNQRGAMITQGNEPLPFSAENIM